MRPEVVRSMPVIETGTTLLKIRTTMKKVNKITIDDSYDTMWNNLGCMYKCIGHVNGNDIFKIILGTHVAVVAVPNSSKVKLMNLSYLMADDSVLVFNITYKNNDLHVKELRESLDPATFVNLYCETA